MAGLSIFTWVLIILAAVFQVVLIVKFYRMCNDVRALRKHFVEINHNETKKQAQTEKADTKGSDLSWLWPVAIVAMMILLIVLLQ